MKIKIKTIAYVLTTVFLALKLTGKIDWSWWWVVSPALILEALGLLVILLVVALFGKDALRVVSMMRGDYGGKDE